MQHPVKGMLVVITLGANRAQGGFKGGGVHESCHSVISIPSSAISQPSSSRARRSPLS
jgi:hypothetical protein